MPSLSDYKKYLSNNGMTIGEVYKNDSDMIMEKTWDSDIQSKKCYIYDYFHDDQPWLNEGMSYENTTKTPIDAKYIINQSQSIDKDQVTVMLQFKPSEKLRFDVNDDLYYFETDYKGRYNSNYPIGMYCDIPDDKNVYHKHIICAKQIGNQFIKYLILPANYRFSWIETVNNERIIRRVWGATRSQNSYNSGLWTQHYSTEVENQFKAILPMNSITEQIFYVDDANKNQRFIISAMSQNPRTWQVSKVEDMLMGEFGLMRLTFVQVAFNKSIDYIDYNALNPDGTKDVYSMYANYFDSSITPVMFEDEKDPIANSDVCQLLASTNTIKVGGSYKTITASFSDKNGIDITDSYLSNLSLNNWYFYIDNKPIDDGLITILEQPTSNVIKIKFCKNLNYLTKTLEVKCVVNDVVGTLSFEITNL